MKPGLPSSAECAVIRASHEADVGLLIERDDGHGALGLLTEDVVQMFHPSNLPSRYGILIYLFLNYSSPGNEFLRPSGLLRCSQPDGPEDAVCSGTLGHSPCRAGDRGDNHCRFHGGVGRGDLREQVPGTLIHRADRREHIQTQRSRTLLGS